MYKIHYICNAIHIEAHVALRVGADIFIKAFICALFLAYRNSRKISIIIGSRVTIDVLGYVYMVFNAVP